MWPRGMVEEVDAPWLMISDDIVTRNSKTFCLGKMVHQKSSDIINPKLTRGSINSYTLSINPIEIDIAQKFFTRLLS